MILLSLLFGFSAFISTNTFLKIADDRVLRRQLNKVFSEVPTKPKEKKAFWLCVKGAGLAALISICLWPSGHWIHGGAACLGFILPWLTLREKETRRRRRHLRDLPDFLELLALSLSSGLNLESAFRTALQYLPTGSLNKELQRTIDAFSLGQLREEALKEFCERLRNPSLSGIFALIIQSMKRGAPLQNILLSQAEHLRSQYLVSVEKEAQTAGIRLLFPIMIFIFPTLFMVLFGGLFLQYIQTGKLF